MVEYFVLTLDRDIFGWKFSPANAVWFPNPSNITQSLCNFCYVQMKTSLKLDLFLPFLHFHSCSSFFFVPLFHLLYYFYYLFSAFLWEMTQNDPQGLTCRQMLLVKVIPMSTNVFLWRNKKTNFIWIHIQSWAMEFKTIWKKYQTLFSGKKKMFNYANLFQPANDHGNRTNTVCAGPPFEVQPSP